MTKLYYSGEGFWDETEPPVSDEMVQYAENKLGIIFPLEYVALLKESNGGTMRFQYVDVDGFGKCTMPEMLGMKDEGIFSFMEENEEYPLPKNSILLAWETYPHACFALDFADGIENPSVVYFYENYQVKGVVYSKTMVAPTFQDFLPLLYTQPLLTPAQLQTSWKKKK